MRYLTVSFIVILSGWLIVGCSSGSTNSPVVPAETGFNSAPTNTGSSPVIETPPGIDIPRADFSPLAEGDVKEDPSGILYAGTLEFDAEAGTVTNTLDRGPMINFDITGYLYSGGCAGGCFRFVINSIVDEIWDIDVTIENPVSIQAFDVRLIFTALGEKKIANTDGYTDLFDPPGQPFINPFIAFATDYFLRPFPMGPGGIDTQKLLLYWPTGDPPIISYIVTASLPFNTEEPFTIEDFQQVGDLYWQGGECNLGVVVDDWQFDITAVRADTQIFNNQIPFLVSDPEHPEQYEVHIVNENNVYPGTYPILFKAESPNAQNASMYNIFDVTVTGPPQHEPICDFYVDPDFIYVGQTTMLTPGPGISDPDDDDIVLYEFDYYYNDGVFHTMASNTTGEPIQSPPAPYLGPNPIDITMALRITDDGVPPMSSICTDVVTISPNQEPICDLEVDPEEIASGGTTMLSPGPLCGDPDGDIILYEYDFDYDFATFNVDGSNTTGVPIETTPYPNPGPDPITKTVALRVTDDGAPALTSICTKEISIVVNQSPLCELILSEYEINSGASVDCWPGPGTIDPDGIIALYEYDFDYDFVTFDVDDSNTTGDPVATGPIDNTSPDPIIFTIAMRVTDDGTPAATKICTKDLLIIPISTAPNPWRNPAVRVTPYNLDWASIDRDRMENNLCVNGDDVYVVYHGQIDGNESFFIQRSADGGVTFNAPQDFGYPVHCIGCIDNDFIAMDVLVNGWVCVASFSYHDGCGSTTRAKVRFTICKPNGSGGLDMDPPITLIRARGDVFSTQNGDGFQSVDVAAHPSDPDICFVDAIDLDHAGGSDGPDDTSIWKVYDITTNPTETIEFAVVEPVCGAPPESGHDKAHMDAACDYNGNLHVVWCSRDLGTIYYSMVYGNSTFPYDHTEYEKINDFGETYPEGAHIAIDNNNVAYIAYAATGIPGEIEPQEIGMLTGVGYPPEFPDAPFILNHDREGDQVYPDIKFDQTTGDLWVAYTTFAFGPGQITFELYDAEDGWTQFEPDYWINKDDPLNEHNDEHVHLYLVSQTGTAYAIWEESDGPNAPHIYFNRTH